MPSDTGAVFASQFFDGETAVTHAVSVTAGEDALVFTGPNGAERRWRYGDLIAIDSLVAGDPLRISHAGEHGARLVLPPSAQPLLLERAPHLKGGISAKRALRTLAIIALCVIATAGAGYGVVALAPQLLAQLMPESWRERLGNSAEASFVGKAKRCESAKGVQALDALSARLLAAAPEKPKFTARVFDLPIVNAFALPGGHIIVTRKLIEQAADPDQVAGVLAHELGHVVLRHPEAQLVRVLGLNMLLSLASGGGSDTIGGFASLLAILRYGRSAEREADAFAQTTLEQAKVDPLGLKRFLESVRKSETTTEPGFFDGIGNILSTHPGTQERIKAMRPLADGTARPALDATQWADLKKICE
ncbi:MAG: M48 family metallopeptidase [Parvibaculaceae bacterium]